MKKIGQYAVMNSGSMDGWFEKEKKKQKKSKDIIHPIFSELASVYTDSYWSSFFNKASNDRFPSGFSYKNEILMFKKGKKSFRLHVPMASHEEIKDFFGRYTGVLGVDNNQSFLERLEPYRKCYVSWNKITSGRIKEYYIRDFCEKMTIKNNLDTSTSKQLLSLLTQSLSNGSIKRKDIIFSKEEIKEIIGLEFDEEEGIFTFPQCARKNIKKTSSSKKKGSFLEIWSKMLQKEGIILDEDNDTENSSQRDDSDDDDSLRTETTEDE